LVISASPANLAAMSRRKRCKECRTPVDPNADYCGRCGAGVKTIPVGCAIIALLGVIIAAFLILRYFQSAISN